MVDPKGSTQNAKSVHWCFPMRLSQINKWDKFNREIAGVTCEIQTSGFPNNLIQLYN